MSKNHSKYNYGLPLQAKKILFVMIRPLNYLNNRLLIQRKLSFGASITESQF
nr:MAG TPA: hypothetical protein [Caudoviricetes sp.]